MDQLDSERRRSKFIKKTTSMGFSLQSNDMVVTKEQEEEEEKNQEDVAAALPKLGAEFKKRSKEAFEMMILRQRFEDTKDRSALT